MVITAIILPIAKIIHLQFISSTTRIKRVGISATPTDGIIVALTEAFVS